MPPSHARSTRMVRYDPDVPIWERQEKESGDHYRWFCFFRDMGISHRSVKAVGEHFSSEISAKHLWTIARVLGWVERALAYDDYLDRMFRQQRETDLIRTKDRHLVAARKIQEHLLKRLDTVDPARIPYHQIPVWFDTAVKIERLALGLSTENRAVKGSMDQEKADSGNAVSIDFSLLTDEELRVLQLIALRVEKRQAARMIEAPTA